MTPDTAAREAYHVATPVARVAGASVLSEPSAAARKAAIRRALAPICPRPLADAELGRAAAFGETHCDRGAVWIVARLDQFDPEARLCRGDR